jgi:hypothetical protein
LPLLPFSPAAASSSSSAAAACSGSDPRTEDYCQFQGGILLSGSLWL